MAKKNSEKVLKKCFTIETRLDKKQFPVEYFEKDIEKQSRLFRIVWNLIQKSPKEQSELNTYLQVTYHIDKRTANTIIQGVKGRLNALKELKQLECTNLENKIRTVEIQIENIKEDLDSLKHKITTNKANEKQLKKYRCLKKKIWEKKQRLNRMNQKLNQYKNQIDKKYYPLCWGTKKLFKARYNLKENKFRSHDGWLNAFRRKRDSQVNYIGSADEPKGNQNCQLSYDKKGDSFSLRIRKDLELMENEEDKFFTITGIKFKLHRNVLIDAINAGRTPFTFRILRRGRKWYLQVIFTWIKDKKKQEEEIQDTSFGTIGLDFNKGFISLSETDYFGNLVFQKHCPLKYHGTGNKASSEMQEMIAKIVKIAVEKKKPIVIEDLNFCKKKSKAVKSYGKKGKQYNKMLNTLDYSRYKTRMENACFRNNVKLILVNPAYTSQIGEEKFGKRMKLNRHQAASYVIARKGQGFQDRLDEKIFKKKAS